MKYILLLLVGLTLGVLIGQGRIGTGELNQAMTEFFDTLETKLTQEVNHVEDVVEETIKKPEPVFDYEDEEDNYYSVYEKDEEDEEDESEVETPIVKTGTVTVSDVVIGAEFIWIEQSQNPFDVTLSKFGIKILEIKGNYVKYKQYAKNLEEFGSSKTRDLVGMLKFVPAGESASDYDMF